MSDLLADPWMQGFLTGWLVFGIMPPAYWGFVELLRRMRWRKGAKS